MSKTQKPDEGFVLEDHQEDLSQELTAEYGTAKIKFKYRVNAFTPELEEELTDEDGYLLLKTPNRLGYIKALIGEWDVRLTKADAAPAEIDLPVLRRLPHPLLTAIVKAIMDDSGPNDTSATA